MINYDSLREEKGVIGGKSAEVREKEVGTDNCCRQVVTLFVIFLGLVSIFMLADGIITHNDSIAWPGGLLLLMDAGLICISCCDEPSRCCQKKNEDQRDENRSIQHTPTVQPLQSDNMSINQYDSLSNDKLPITQEKKQKEGQQQINKGEMIH